jgi:CubicO group peptidase (beta-lactamase class C family)
MNSQKFFRFFLLLLCLVVLFSPKFGSVLASPIQEADTEFKGVDDYVREQMREIGLPGIALGIVQDGQIKHLQGFGRADASGRSVTPQTPFRIGSLTKSFTALAVMQLVEEGKIHLDAPVQTYLPWFTLADKEAAAKITVRNLLNQTSGISQKDGNSLFASKTGLEETIRSLNRIKLTQPVGSTYQYCNINFMIAGLIVEVVSGNSFDEYVSEHIFDALDMRHSHASLDSARTDGLAMGHIFMFGRLWENDGWVPPSNLPAGALIASIEDMAKYAIAQMNGGRYAGNAVLSPEGIDELHAPAIMFKESEYYAMGWTVGEMEGKPSLYHSGDDGRFHSVIFLLPEEDSGIILLSNATGFTQSGQIDQIAAGLVNILNEKSAQPVAASLITVFLYWLTLLTPLLMILGILLIRRGFDRINGWKVVIIVAVYLGLVLLLFQLSLQIITLPSMLVFYPEIGYALIATAIIGIGWSIYYTVTALLKPRASLEKFTEEM